MVKLKLFLINHSNERFIVERGMRIHQMVIARYEQILWDETDLLGIQLIGVLQGFGSTGKF